MCGICGFIGFKDDSLLSKMNNKQKHRGPDFSSTYFDDEISLGHTRLSIIDLSKDANQPLFNEDKSIVIVYNGEIYNYETMRSELKSKGHKFRSQTDSEVIVHAYEEYGVEAFALFNGMFAFALWDKNLKQMFLVRDRLGIKPLYYRYDQGKLIFSSEIKALLEFNEITKALNPKALIEYLTYQNVFGEKTFFDNINILQPGKFLRYSNGNIEVKTFWDFEFKIDNDKNIAGSVFSFKNLFNKSVKSHLMSDVPLGCYLSGGFDSTSVSILASKNTENRIRTFTGRFDDGADYDESSIARSVANKISSIHSEITIQPQDFIDNIKKFNYHMDEPKVGPGIFSQYMVAKSISKQVKVVLTGHGGDELLTGYPVHKAFWIMEKLKLNKFNILKLSDYLQKNEFKFFIYFSLFRYLNPQIKYGLPILFDKKELKKLLSADFYSSFTDISPDQGILELLKDKEFNPIERLQYLQFKTYLPSLLVAEDKISMAHSLESRTPLCDNSLIDFSLSTSVNHKINKNKLKFLIKYSMRNHLPKELYGKSKKGFPTPIDKWFRNDLQEIIKDILFSGSLENRGIFSIDYIKKIFKQHVQSNTNTPFDMLRSQKLWMIINIELWFQNFLDN